MRGNKTVDIVFSPKFAVDGYLDPDDVENLLQLNHHKRRNLVRGNGKPRCLRSVKNHHPISISLLLIRKPLGMLQRRVKGQTPTSRNLVFIEVFGKWVERKAGRMALGSPHWRTESLQTVQKIDGHKDVPLD